jgi:hypothetical protein
MRGETRAEYGERSGGAAGVARETDSLNTVERIWTFTSLNEIGSLS